MQPTSEHGRMPASYEEEIVNARAYNQCQEAKYNESAEPRYNIGEIEGFISEQKLFFSRQRKERFEIAYSRRVLLERNQQKKVVNYSVLSAQFMIEFTEENPPTSRLFALHLIALNKLQGDAEGDMAAETGFP